MRLLQRLPDVDHREKRKDEGLQETDEQTETHEDRGKRDRHEAQPDHDDFVICKHVGEKPNPERQDPRAMQHDLEGQEEGREHAHVVVLPADFQIPKCRNFDMPSDRRFIDFSP